MIQGRVGIGEARELTRDQITEDFVDTVGLWLFL